MKKRKLITSLILGLSIPLITTTTIFSLSNASVNKKIFYLFNNKYYSNIDEATDDYLKEYNPVKSKLHIGDFSDAIFNKNSNELDISKLKEFDRSKVLPAYKNAVGNYEHDFNKAKKSFINPGLIQYKYDDLNGKLFNSRSEAKQSMVSSTFRNPIGYYDIFLNGEQKLFNPLNKEDIKIFKEELLNDSLINPNNLALYGLTSNYDSINNSYFSQIQLENKANIIKKQEEIASLYFAIKHKFLSEKVKFKASVKKQTHYVGNNIFRFTREEKSSNINTNPNVIVNWNENEIIYRNLNFNDLAVFGVFIDRDSFFKSFDTSTEHWNLAEVGRSAVIDLFGKGIKLQFDGNGWTGINPGVDFDILKPGSYGDGGVYFLLDIELENPQKAKIEFIEFLKQEYQRVINLPKDFFGLKDQLFHTIFSKAWEFDKSYFDRNYVISLTTNKFSKDNNIKRQYLEIDDNGKENFSKRELELIEKIKNYDFEFKENIKYNINPKNEEMLDSYNIHILSILNNKYTLSNFINYFGFMNNKNLIETTNNINFNNYKIILHYNNVPVFEVPWTHSLMQNLKDNFVKFPNNENIDLIVKNIIINHIQTNTEDKKFILDNLINISTKFINYNRNMNVLLVDNKTNNYIVNKIKNINNKLEYDFENYKEFNPSLTPNIWTKDADYKIDMALNAYNRTLEYYKLDNEFNNDNKNIISKDDVIILYDKSGPPLSMYYSEFLSNKVSFNISLMNKVNNNLYNDEAKITNAIQASQTLEPGKVVVLYDLMGNIINPGVKLSESEELLTSSDAIYDSEQTILDNLFRTKIIRPEINKVFYKDNNEYLLLKNQVDMVYSLNINNKITHFSTYTDAKRYLYEYILFNAIKVER